MSERTSALHRPHVLIVSDDQDLTQFLAEGLVYGGFWTSTIASGIQTLEVFRLRSFDLALIDAGLRDLNAAEVVRRLRGTSNRSSGGAVRTDIPIIVIAASDDEAAAIDPIAAGADAIKTPPLDLEEFVPELHGIVQRWREERPGRAWADAAAQAKP